MFFLGWNFDRRCRRLEALNKIFVVEICCNLRGASCRLKYMFLRILKIQKMEVDIAMLHFPQWARPLSYSWQCSHYPFSPFVYLLILVRCEWKKKKYKVETMTLGFAYRNLVFVCPIFICPFFTSAKSFFSLFPSVWSSTIIIEDRHDNIRWRKKQFPFDHKESIYRTEV